MTDTTADPDRVDADDIQHFDITLGRYGQGDRAGYQTLIVSAGDRGVEHVVPPAGDAYAFDRRLWARRVEVTVSPTGRSVRVFVDGDEVPAP